MPDAPIAPTAADELDDDDPQAALEATALTRVILLTGFAIGLVAILVFLMNGSGKGWFEKKAGLHAHLKDASGIIVGSTVRLNGIPVGRVSKTGLSGSRVPNRQIYVDMRVAERFLSMIPVDSLAEVASDNLMGDNYLNITTGKSPKLVQPEAELLPRIREDQFNPADLLKSLEAAIADVTQILTEIEDQSSPLGQVIMGEGIYKNVLAKITKARDSIRQISSPVTQMGSLMFTDKAYQDLRQPLDQLQKALDEVDRRQGPAGPWIQDSRAYDDALKQVKVLRQSLAELHSNPDNLLNSEDAYENLRDYVRLLNTAMDMLLTGGGPAESLLSSDDLYISLERQSHSVGLTLKDFRQNPKKFLRLNIF